MHAAYYFLLLLYPALLALYRPLDKGEPAVVVFFIVDELVWASVTLVEGDPVSALPAASALSIFH